MRGCMAGMGLISSLVSCLWGGCREQQYLQPPPMFLCGKEPPLQMMLVGQGVSSSLVLMWDELFVVLLAMAALKGFAELPLLKRGFWKQFLND